MSIVANNFYGRAAPGCDENLNKSVGHEVSDDIV
jgi:hypothetical protein